jgi:hypothetical protein
MEVRRGQTSYLKYDLDKKTMKVLSSNTMTFKDAKRMKHDIDNILKMGQPSAKSAPDVYETSSAPWWLRIFGWDTITKKAT